VVNHEGPEWVYFMTLGQTHAETGDLLMLDVVSWRLEEHQSLTPGQLRQVAADALAAAHWLESQA
jgi:hypothetical protein